MPKVVSAYHKVPDRVRAAGAILAKRAAESHVAVSKQLAPVDTGFLRDNIHAEQKGPMTWDVISEAPYSAVVEFEQPFFLPGFESAQRQLREEAPQVIAAQLLAISIGVGK